MRVTIGTPLELSLFFPADAVKCVTMLKAPRGRVAVVEFNDDDSTDVLCDFGASACATKANVLAKIDEKFVESKSPSGNVQSSRFHHRFRRVRVSPIGCGDVQSSRFHHRSRRVRASPIGCGDVQSSRFHHRFRRVRASPIGCGDVQSSRFQTEFCTRECN
jgi:hypothetical protein